MTPDYRKHPSYATGYEAGLASRPRRGRSNAYDAGYDAGIDAANLFLANGFVRDCGGFRIALGPITVALLNAASGPLPYEAGDGAYRSAKPRAGFTKRTCDSDGTATAAANEDLPVPKDCQARAESIAKPLGPIGGGRTT